MKKIFNLMLTFVLTLVVLIPGVSAVTTANDGTITINGTIKDKVYNIYQILVLDSYADVDNDGIDDEDGYIYKLPSEAKWVTFINSDDVKDVYLSVDNQGYVTWVSGADQKEFAKLAKQYAIDNDISPAKTSQKATTDNQEITFTGLQYGYYLVDSSLGVLCGLTTTRPNATVIEKNSEPTVTKEVLENSEGTLTDGADTNNTAFIGETVTYQIKITVGAGAENYKLYDKMDAGLTYDGNSNLTVKLNGKNLTKDTDYVFVDDADYTFVIKFVKELKQNDVIVVDYTATLNENAIVGGNGNKNKAILEYGDSHRLESETITYTYSFDLVKTDSANKLLLGAKFELYNAQGTKIYLVLESEGVYRVSYTGGVGDSAVIEAGKVTIKGLDTGSYSLKEIENPDGYTKLLVDKTFSIGSSNNPANMDEDTYVSGGVQVINTKGNLLPETGGIGTTLFIVIGSLMVALFGLLLVTKYRMSKMDN